MTLPYRGEGALQHSRLALLDLSAADAVIAQSLARFDEIASRITSSVFQILIRFHSGAVVVKEKFQFLLGG
ncbi:hypothetical protein NKJ26_02675 [Mesorhizobium sp. M0152]|uniref:hypothetical protein n=1 Tax=Mesorhizobium sp. M0152 TaxID=2956898 RepID=UPI00333BB0E3